MKDIIDIRSLNNISALMGNLTYKEREVLGLVIKGLSDKEISKELYITLNTVKTHMKNILSKMGCVGRKEVIVRVLSETFEKGTATHS